MKPVGAEKLWQVLDRAAEKLRKDEQVLTLEIGGEMVRIPIYQIRYIDVYGNYATIHGRENYKVRKTLGELASLLDERFYRAGRSVIVNLTCIRRVTKTDIYLNDGSSLPLPRGAYEGVNQAIIHL
jgi:DNA-binding LytR/AlgR family response regulator